MHNTEIIALLLAGGQGSRLGVLTKTIAKPAVLYGGKYRIIDFSLSNCINSGIDTVGVLTQYQPLKLNSHIGIGKPWDMDRIKGGVTILSPFLKADIGEWYLGTANAVYQNIQYVENISPKYVVILSGDHIYKMDYAAMLDFHKTNSAHATISVINVPYEEASRFGIMNTDESGKIYEFDEKPDNPKSTLASMGVYMFSWDILKKYLEKDNENLCSEHDFGKNIIPMMLNDGCDMWAYNFNGYWKDVGTIEAYWESNLELINRIPQFNLYEPAWKIYTPNYVNQAHYIGPEGNIKRTLVAEGCEIYGQVINSVIFPGVKIGQGASVEDSIVMSNSVIGSSSCIKKSIIGEKVVIGNNVKMGVGEFVVNELRPGIYYSGITVVGEEATVPANATIGKNVMIDIGVNESDFYSLDIESGKSICKGGDCE